MFKVQRIAGKITIVGDDRDVQVLYEILQDHMVQVARGSLGEDDELIRDLTTLLAIK